MNKFANNFLKMIIQNILIILIFLIHQKAISASSIFYGGIPVPGRRIPAIRSFELFINTCRSSPMLEKLSQLIRNVNAEQIADKMQRNLYFAVDDLDIGAIMGKWYTMIYEPSIQPDHCIVTKFNLMDKNANFGAFSVLQYSLRPSDASIRISHGIGRKYGPDPSSLLINTGQQGEPCPYFPIKAGPIRPKDGKYAYLVMTQALKQPTLVLARDPDEFDAIYGNEVRQYLTQFGYWNNPLTGGELREADWTKCAKESPFYAEIEDEDGLMGRLDGRE